MPQYREQLQFLSSGTLWLRLFIPHSSCRMQQVLKVFEWYKIWQLERMSLQNLCLLFAQRIWLSSELHSGWFFLFIPYLSFKTQLPRKISWLFGVSTRSHLWLSSRNLTSSSLTSFHRCDSGNFSVSWLLQGSLITFWATINIAICWVTIPHSWMNDALLLIDKGEFQYQNRRLTIVHYFFPHDEAP